MIKRELPRYVYRQRNGLYFQRRGWPTRKFRNQEVGPAFYAEYAEILKGRPPETLSRRNFKALIASYHKSQRYRGLKPRTQADYDKRLEFIEKRMGHLDPAKMQRKHVIRLRDDNADRYRNANYLVQVIRVLFEHAIDIGWVERNPAKGVKLLKSPYEERQPWPAEKVRAFRGAYDLGTRERLLFELLIGTGQRIGDILKMRWDDIAGGAIRVKQGKTGKVLWLPFTDDLRAALAAAPRRGLTILANHSATGPWSYRGASQAMRVAREKIGALEYDLHSLRYTTATELLLAGCDDDLIAAITGQSRPMVAKYTASVR